CLQETNWSLAF
nr:immunoglobulin light chain junction region [Macaca mulatta]MOV62828.1 immunoglobulin light chain junction region [Macaca mulatta]MOV63007.1 immunoglobulin light chain junction region [Macaca mulatta]MOV63009.1 immunoglobulin light chain junction region [Macaca mulatta]MOV63206.1 immunoglobulin light chain junction region [Macaca mulatta]